MIEERRQGTVTAREEAGVNLISLVREMVLALVDEPGSVRIDGYFVDGVAVVNVTVARGDLGKVIGKQGRTARSLRTILAASAMKHKVRCELNIVESRQERGAA